jgi:hypothetical protein
MLRWMLSIILWVLLTVRLVVDCCRRYIVRVNKIYLLFQIITDKYLHVLGDDKKSVFAIGDCADIQDMPLPCTAQVSYWLIDWLVFNANFKSISAILCHEQIL